MSGKLSVKNPGFALQAVFFLLIFPAAAGQGGRIEGLSTDEYRKVSDFVDENERCFACHGESVYQFAGDPSALVIKKLMCHDMLVLREDYYHSNHKSFSCLDCHPDECLIFPHPREVRMDEHNDCIDCHGNVKHWAHYQFEKIQEEYNRSIHHLANPEGFSCWKCHNPHTYHISIRDTKDLTATIAYDNAICLSCHSDYNRFQLLTEHSGTDIIEEHEWLPNQRLHFNNIRCIDCHTQMSDSILVAHLILPKAEAVRHCSECHSKNTLLMETLYKFQSREARQKYGFLNAAVMSHAYVIGANRNYVLGTISLIIFGLVFAGIILHLLFRIKNRT